MSIIIKNSAFMFTMFDRDGEYFMTAVAGGVGQYDLTIRVPKEDVEQFKLDENKPIALARNLITRTSAYEDRLMRPFVDPS